MLPSAMQLDREITLAINALHSPGLDGFMIFMSEKWVWLPLYGFLIYLIFKNFTPKQSFLILVAIAAGIALSDQSASSLLKPFFKRLRPCHQPDMMLLLHLPKGCGGQFGFASSHAANSFCLAVFFLQMLGSKYKWLVALVVWAMVVCYSRVYLGAHYVGDVLVGAAIGGSLGGLLAWLLKSRFGVVHSPLVSNL